MVHINGQQLILIVPIVWANKLDESTARRQLKSPRSLYGRSIHLTLVTKWSWSWSWMTYCHPFVQCQSAVPFWDTAISKFDHQCHVWLSKFKGQGYGQGQTYWSHLRPGVRSICLIFVLWQWDHFWLRYRKFHIWPWKFKVKVMAKVKPDGHIYSLELNR